MPQAGNITVKKNDGTTDIVYTSVVASAGDKTPAIFRSNTVGTAVAQRPELKVMSRDNGPLTARRVESAYVYPVLATGTDGKVNVVDKIILNVTGVVPKTALDTDVNEAVSQCFNLHAAVLLKDTFKSGYAPT